MISPHSAFWHAKFTSSPSYPCTHFCKKPSKAQDFSGENAHSGRKTGRFYTLFYGFIRCLEKRHTRFGLAFPEGLPHGAVVST
jgi:hypothetical protein